MSDPKMQQIIRESLRETRAWGWSENDTLYAACGAALKYAEAQGQESTPELRAALMATVREEMKLDDDGPECNHHCDGCNQSCATWEDSK